MTDAPPPAYKRKLFWVALLYFSEGLPLGVFFDIFPVYFRQQGVNLADIGLLSLLGLAWTVKFLWAPLVDWAREAAPQMLDQHPLLAEQHIQRWLGTKSDYLKA